MSHFAKVENGIVTQVIVAEQDVIDSKLFGDGWIQTSYNTHGGKHPNNTPLRKNYAGVGYIYDEDLDAFYMPQPYLSWTLDIESCLWQSPVPYPQDGKHYQYDESIINWVEVINE
jgi:hypothetical protein